MFSFFLLAVILIIASIYDIRYRRVPDWLTLLAIIIGVLLTRNWQGAIIGAGCITIAGVLGIAILKQEVFGGADVKLIATVGAFLGVKVVLLTFFIAPIFALLYGGLMKKEKLKYLPYAPAISLAAGVSYIWANFGF